MKKYFICMMLCNTLAWAAPITQVQVNRPTTAVSRQMPSTHTSVTHPFTTGTVGRPTTSAPLPRPTTQTTVTRPTTTVSTQHMFTQTTVSRPTTAVSVLRPGQPGRNNVDDFVSTGKASRFSGGGSYEPSYKNVKNLTPTAAPPAPKAAELSAGQAGLGMTDSQQNQKDQLAKEERKTGESSQISIDEVLKKTKLPPNLAGILKQKNFEASKGGGKK